MSQVTQAMRNHHRELANTLKTRLSALEADQAEAEPLALVTFLKTDLLPHAQGEERSLYPVVDGLVGEHGRPTATMSIDHEFIEGYIREIETSANALASSGNGDRAALREHLILLGRRLEGLFQVHLEKEERVYLPLFEKYLPESEQQRVLDGMHDAHEAAPESRK
jgi:hemerythrin-like domain-containing protein